MVSTNKQVDTCTLSKYKFPWLVADADGLSRAAAEGALSTRADAEQHEGDFRRVIEGVNRTLDQVIAPVDAAVSTLEALAGKDLRARVTGTYRGGHARIQRAKLGRAVRNPLKFWREAYQV